MLVIVVYLLGALDILLTHFGLQRGFISEANPVMAWLFREWGEAGVYVALVGSGLALLVLYRACNRTRYLRACFLAVLLLRVIVLTFHLDWLRYVSHRLW